MCFRPLAGEEGKPEAEGGTLQSTGQLGDVMKESTEIAYTFAKVESRSFYIIIDSQNVMHLKS